MSYEFSAMPDEQGFFGEYGGQMVPSELKAVMDDINDSYETVRATKEYREELEMLYADYVGGRPQFILQGGSARSSVVQTSTSNAKTSIIPEHIKSTTVWVRRFWPNIWAKRKYSPRQVPASTA